MLTEQKKKFADALKTGVTQREAAIHAGYSEKTAKVKGSRLAKDIDIIAYLKRLESAHPTGEQVNQVVGLSGEDALPEALEVMARIMRRHETTDPKLALEAAAKLAPYTCNKKTEVGKKESKTVAAKKAAKGGRFGPLPPPPPKLVVNNKG